MSFGNLHSSYILSSVITGRFEDNLDKQIVVIPALPCPNVPTIHFKSFFHLSRLENLYFDVVQKTGILFLLSQRLLSGMIGIISIEQQMDSSLSGLLRALAFLRRQGQVDNKKKKFEGVVKQGKDLPSIDDVFGKIKVDLKIQPAKYTMGASQISSNT